MSERWRDRGSWTLRAATVLLIVSSSVRYFGDSPASESAATWILILALGVGLIGIALTVVDKRRKAAPSTDDNGQEAA